MEQKPTPDDIALQPVPEEPKKKFPVAITVVFAVLVGLGVGTGYLLSRTVSGSFATSLQGPGYIKSDNVAGITDTETFKDSAQGVIQKGGLNGEGTHKLIREGGDSQTAYLVSSVVNLDDYVGKKVKVWGATLGAQKAAWLMDVGKVEVE